VEERKMKHWSQWALVVATILPVVCVLACHARARLQTSQALEGHSSIVLCESCAESEGTIARIRAKARVADELIGGRLSLVRAAAAFRGLDKHWPRVLNAWAAFPSASSEDERFCLQVIGYVGTEAPPQRAAELIGRLHAELDAMLQNGTLHLPDSDDAPSPGGG
jgi:hypothetical protein